MSTRNRFGKSRYDMDFDRPMFLDDMATLGSGAGRSLNYGGRRQSTTLRPSQRVGMRGGLSGRLRGMDIDFAGGMGRDREYGRGMGLDRDTMGGMGMGRDRELGMGRQRDNQLGRTMGGGRPFGRDRTRGVNGMGRDLGMRRPSMG